MISDPILMVIKSIMRETYIICLFVDSKLVLAYEAVSMEDRADYSVQLGTIQNILWKNIATLNSSVSLKLYVYIFFVFKYYSKSF